ncbi:MAG: hypothetical protein WDZ49_15735 [Litorilinea sp.]
MRAARGPALGTLIPSLERGSIDHTPALRFEQVSELVCGIETEINDRRVGWNIRDYLAQVEQELDASILD